MSYIFLVNPEVARKDESDNRGDLPEIKTNVLTPRSADVPHPIADFLPCTAKRTVGIDVSMSTGTFWK